MPRSVAATDAPPSPDAFYLPLPFPRPRRDAINFMGYTMRTVGEDLGSWRYTEWATWNGAELRPDWTRLAGRELFNHTGDDGMAWVFDDATVGEYENLVSRPELAGKVAQLSARLHAEVGKYITPLPPPSPYNG